MEPSIKTLAEGCFGKVYKQKYGDKWAALKKVPVQHITKQALIRECRVYEKAQHNNVVKLLGEPWLEDGKWHIPLEFVFGEDLETTMFGRKKSKIQLTSSVKNTIITGMCEGLNFLHSKDIVHQDLKPDNIMIEHGSLRAVIIDMGLAKFFKNGLSSAMNMGNEAYSAPEIWQGGVRDKRSDVWAVGKIIAELCQMVRFRTDILTPLIIKEFLNDSPYCSVVSRMMVTSASKRATMSGVIDEIRQIMEGAGGQNPGSVAASGAGAALDHGVWSKMFPLGHFPPEAKHHGAFGKQIHDAHCPFLKHLGLVPFPREELGNMLHPMPFPGPLPPGGMVSELVYKQKIIRNGKVVKDEVVKITK